MTTLQSPETSFADLDQYLHERIAKYLRNPADLSNYMQSCKSAANASKDAMNGLKTKSICKWKLTTLEENHQDTVFFGAHFGANDELADISDVGIFIKVGVNEKDKFVYVFISIINENIEIKDNPRYEKWQTQVVLYEFMIWICSKRLEYIIRGKDSNETLEVYRESFNGEITSSDTYRKYIETAAKLLNDSKGTSKQGGGQIQSSTSYVKTNKKHKSKDNIERVLYKKGDSMYVKKKSAKTGKMVYTKVKA